MCCTPFVEVYHPWMFTPSMDEYITSSVRFTRLVADGPTNRNKIHGWGYWSIDRATPLIVICTITWRQKSCAPCAITCQYIIYHLVPNDLPICNEKRSKRVMRHWRINLQSCIIEIDNLHWGFSANGYIICVLISPQWRCT